MRPSSSATATAPSELKDVRARFASDTGRIVSKGVATFDPTSSKVDSAPSR